MLRDRELLGDEKRQRRVFDTPDTPVPAAHAEPGGRQARGPAHHPFRTRAERKSPAKEPARPNFSIDGYELLECRGKGGMGQVYRAIQKSLGREVAIKTLDLNLARHQASIMRFTKEAAAMAHLRHPNIVQVIDRGSSRQRHYFVMEFVDGPSLRELLREGAFAPPEALQIMLQLARTMAYAHKQGVIHRDLKPENILYTADGVLKVADFGLAGVEHETTYIRKLTRSFVSMGTECYMAPEQRRDAKNVDFRADLYSMGVIFYELLTNQIPFPQMPPAHVAIAPGYPNIDRLIRCCLSSDPEDRFGSTEAMVLALEAALEEVERAPVMHRDTVIDTPAVEPKGDASESEVGEEPLPPIEGRLSGWVKSAISDAGDHVSMSWRQGSLRKFLVSGASLLALAGAVGLFFLLSPAPPAPKITPKERARLVWKVPAHAKTLADQRQQLSFGFQTGGSANSAWRRRPRELWTGTSKGNWSANPQKIEQNTYRHSVILNHKNLWAVYKGHILEGPQLSIQGRLKIKAPLVPMAGRGLIPLAQFLSQSLPALRNARRHPTIGLGLQGDRGQRIALVLKPRGARLAYSFVVRTKGNKARVENGILRAHFQYSMPLRVKLMREKDSASAWINGERIDKIKLSPQDLWPGHAGLICRDAHCVYKSLKIQAKTTRQSDS